jgi:hypothetical protein
MASARTLSVLVLVPLVALAGCGGSTKKVDPAADLAVAKAAVLTAADLPGYTDEPHAKSDDLPDAQKKSFAACMGAPTTIFDDVPGAQKADSPDFSKEPAAQVSNSVSIDPKKSDVEDRWKQLASSKAAPCFQKLFETVFKAGAEGAPNVTFGPMDVTKFDPGVGDRSVGYSVTFSATSSGRNLKFFADVLFLPRDRAEIEIDFFNQDTPTSRSFETALAQKVYDRVGSGAK